MGLSHFMTVKKPEEVAWRSTTSLAHCSKVSSIALSAVVSRESRFIRVALFIAISALIHSSGEAGLLLAVDVELEVMILNGFVFAVCADGR